MLHVQASPNVNEVELARAFLTALVKAEANASHESSASTSAVDALLGEPSVRSPGRLAVKPSLGACAVALAAGIAAVPGLLVELRSRSPVIVFEAGQWAETSIERVLEAAFFGDLTVYPESTSRAPLMVVRNGSDKNHVPAHGNDGVLEAISAGWPVIAISRDPKRYLPSAVHDAVDHIVTVPELNGSRLTLALETICGRPPAQVVEDNLAAAVTSSDIDVCVRPGLAPDDCVLRLREQAKRRTAIHGPTLYDLPGYGAAKTWGIELVGDLAAYRSGELSWDQVDHKAVLISGPPGVGKTQLARSIARTARIPIVETSASAWNSATYLSGTLQMVRAIFAEARSKSPCVLFLDEADGISSRDSIQGEYREYWVQIINQVLTELTSEGNSGVVILAATNFPERIDPAIRRAGRLDYELRLELPDIPAMAEIFRYHLGGDLLDADVGMIATVAQGGSGADVFAWVSRARAKARRQDRSLGVSDVLDAIHAGRPPLEPEARRRVSIHEAGHVLGSWLSGFGTLQTVAIHASGGMAHFAPAPKSTMTVLEFDQWIEVLLAGRIAETILLDAPSAGAGAGSDSDLEQATLLAMDIETRFGFGCVGPVFCPPILSELTRNPLLLAAVRARLSAAEEKMHGMLTAHIRELSVVASALEEKGHLSGDEVHSMLSGGRPEAAS